MVRDRRCAVQHEEQRKHCARTYRSHDGVDPYAALLNIWRDEVELCFGRGQHEGSPSCGRGDVVELNTGHCGYRDVPVHIDAALPVVSPYKYVIEEPHVETPASPPDGGIRNDQPAVVEQQARRY